MSKKVNELLELLRESDATAEPEKGAGSSNSLESQSQKDSSQEPAFVSESKEEKKSESPASEIQESVDPEVAEILKMIEESEEDEDYEGDEDEEEEGEDEDEEEDLKEAKEEQEADFNDVSPVGLSDAELEGVMSDASAEEEMPEGEEGEPVPGSEELDPDKRMMVKRLFDESVREVAKARISKAVKLTEEILNKKFREMTLARESQLNEQVSHYLEYVVETWRKQNEPKIFTAAQVKVAQKIFESVKSLVETFNIETVDISASLIDMYEQKIAKLETDSNKLVTENVALSKEISLRDRALIIEEAAKGLPLTEIENFKAVVAKIKASDLDTFRENVSAMRVSFLPKATKKSESISETNENLAMQGGFGKHSNFVKTEADLIANLISTGIDNHK